MRNDASDGGGRAEGRGGNHGSGYTSSDFFHMNEASGCRLIEDMMICTARRGMPGARASTEQTEHFASSSHPSSQDARPAFFPRVLISAFAMGKLAAWRGLRREHVALYVCIKETLTPPKYQDARSIPTVVGGLWRCPCATIMTSSEGLGRPQVSGCGPPHEPSLSRTTPDAHASKERIPHINNQMDSEAS